MNTIRNTIRTNIRTIAAGTILSLGLVPLGAGTAAADAPTEILDSLTFTGTNPCTGNEHDITINYEVREHQDHRNNFVVTVKRTGTTSDGYVLQHGTESQQWNPNAAHINVNDTWANADGSKYRAHVNVVLKPEGPQVEHLFLRCIQP